MPIHPTTIIQGDVQIDDQAEIGPFCVIKGDVKIGRGTIVESHVTLGSKFGKVIIGDSNHFSPGAVIGGPPQDVSYKSETTELIIGNGNIFREFTTMNLATSKGDKKTEIGNNNYFMSYTHVGHDCKIGNNIIVAQDSHIGGHVEVDDNVTIGGVCAFNQFTKVGKYAFVAGGSVVNKDILPFSRASTSEGVYAFCRATNKVGLLRKGFSKEEVSNIHKAIRIILLGSDTVDEGIARIQAECKMSSHLEYLIHFIKTSKRGIARSRRHRAGDTVFEE